MVSEREWTDYIQEDPDCPHLRNRPPSVVSIFKVPKFLKDTKREPYVPQRVSLGPYHHGSAELPRMGHHKGRAVRTMMKSFNANRNLRGAYNDEEIDFADLARAEILKLENQIRDSYEENIDCDGETLARMLCLDGCFLVQVLRTLSGYELSRAEAHKYYDPIFGERKLIYAAKDVKDDILILENQIPLIVLEKLLELESNLTVDANNLMELILLFFSPFDNKEINIKQLPCQHGHLLGLLHAAIASPPSSSQGERVDPGECRISIDRCCSSKCISMLQGKSKARNDAGIIPHAVELRNAGIKFSPLLQGGINDSKFDENSATIFLPPISIGDRTERVFRNLIAYEMCKPSQINYVTCYVTLMDSLIDSEHDVALLRRMGILTNWLGSEKEVADVFNGLCKELVTAGMTKR